MKKKVKKKSKLYPAVGKNDLNALPATPTRRAACKVIQLDVARRIDARITADTEREALLAKRANDAKAFYSDLDSQLKRLAK